MLYYFPDESPKDLSRKESESLQREIERAERVQTRGYRRKECSLSSSFVKWKCLHEYLQCPLDKWKRPQCSKEKVDLEELPTEFLPPLKPYKPLIFYDHVLKEKVQRVVGFREILKKREHLKYLEEIENSGGWGGDDYYDDGGNSEGSLEEVSSIDSDSDSTSSNETEVEELDEGESECENEEMEEEERRNVMENTGGKLQQQYLRIARGGGGDKDKKKEDKKKSKKDDKGKDKDKDKDKKKKDKKDKEKDKKKKTDNSGPGIFARVFNFVKAKVGLGKNTKKDDKKDKKDKNKKKDTKDKKSKSERGSKPPEPKAKSSRWIFPSLHKDLMKQKLEEKEYQENLEAIFKYHTLFRVPAMKERDSEWLELSQTDPEDQRREAKHEAKLLAPGMIDGVSFESQYLVKSMKPFLWSLKLTGRLFMGVKPDLDKKHMDFSHKKKNILFFFFTSILTWVALCLMATSFMDIQWENQKREGAGQSAPQQAGNSSNLTDTSTDQQDAIDKVEAAYHHVEELELHKYQIPLCVIIINLILVAVWSMLIILGDGILIAHYFNCWCAALAEMETSGSLKIRRRIISYHCSYIVYVSMIAGLFYIDYPSHIRYSCSLIASLICRPIYPNLRVKPKDELLPFQLAGLAFQCYVTYCATMIKLLIQILALVLKNSSEMWNFKFALTFQQHYAKIMLFSVAVKNRGQLFRMGLNHSLLKLFTHHRLLTVLLRNFGEVFAVPIIIYMVCEMAVMTLTMVRMFFYKPGSPDQFGGHETVVIQSIKSINGTDVLTESIEILYYHTPAEENIIFATTLIQMTIQFLTTSETLAAAGNSFFAGYEFVRRCGTMLCQNSHQRRLIQSLEWSFSSTNPSVMSANSYFTIDRRTILGAFTAVAGFFSLIIQLQVVQEENLIEFVNITECRKIGESFELIRGECIGASELDYGLVFINSTHEGKDKLIP